jgi:predicted DNA-binding transcriptional regulator AlpA
MTEIEKNEELDGPEAELRRANDRLEAEFLDPDPEDFSHFTANELAESFDKLVNVEKLPEWIKAEAMPWSNRKEFCEMLGVGESTLFGWLKGDRIPKMVKLVIGLFRQQADIQAALKESEKACDRLKKSDRVVRDGDQFMIIEFPDGGSDKGLGVGRIVAKDIPDEQAAKKLMGRHDLTELLSAVESAEELWLTTGHSALDHYKDIVRSEIQYHLGIERAVRLGR